MILDIVFLVIATEALVEIVVNSTLFYPIRRLGYFVGGWEKWCGYCISFWVAAFFWIMQKDPLISVLIMALVVHRLSNVVHEGFVRWFKRTPTVSVNSVYLKK